MDGQRTMASVEGAGVAGDLGATISFLGGAGTVTGSKLLVEAGGTRILVDCGMFQGPKALRLRNWDPFPFDVRSLDAVVITHAHLDHTGMLPRLVAAGYDGPIHMTRNSAALTGIVLRDAAHLQEEEAAYANRTRYSKHHPALPLYTVDDADRVVELLRPVDLDVSQPLPGGAAATFRQAGHILGAASIQLALPDGRTIFVSGDVGRPEHPLLRGPAPVPPSDVLLTESTYGNREHQPVDEALDRFAGIITRVARRGGVVVIPSFAVDRIEVVLNALRLLREAGRIPDLPVFVDSPMALAVLDVYRQAMARRDPEFRDSLVEDPFDLATVRSCPTPEDSQALNRLSYPFIVIAGSGMATGGRVLHHLVLRLPDPRCAVVLVGFQAESSRGRQLVDGARAIKIHGRYVPVRAEVALIDAFSVHADRDELLEWLSPAPPPQVAYVVHGEPHASDALRDALEARTGWTVVVPRDGERVRA